MPNQCDHIELTTTHPDRARDFYSKLFGWKIQAMPNPGDEGEYLMFQTSNGGGGIAGKMVAEQPTAWMPYISVASVQTAIDTATKLGGDVVMGLTPIGDMGSIAVLRDPTGATIGLWETAKKPAKAPAKKAAPTKKPAAKKAPPPKKSGAKKKKG
jgi:predicted enzyme related to lactoylglutathione lyase